MDPEETKKATTHRSTNWRWGKFLVQTVFVIVCLIAIALVFRHRQEAVAALTSLVVFLETIMAWLLVLIMLMIVGVYSVLFFRTKRREPDIRIIETSCETGARLFFIAAAFLLLFDAGLKVSLQIMTGQVSSSDIIDILIMSATAALLASLHEVLSLLIQPPNRVDEKRSTLERKSTIRVFVFFFGTAILISGLCIARTVLFK